MLEQFFSPKFPAGPALSMQNLIIQPKLTLATAKTKSNSIPTQKHEFLVSFCSSPIQLLTNIVSACRSDFNGKNLLVREANRKNREIFM